MKGIFSSCVEVVEVSERREEEVGRDENTDVHVDQEHLQQEEVRRDENADVHVDQEHLQQEQGYFFSDVSVVITDYFPSTSDVVVTYLASASDVVDQNDELHPTFPLVSLVSVQHRALQQGDQRIVRCLLRLTRALKSEEMTHLFRGVDRWLTCFEVSRDDSLISRCGEITYFFPGVKR